MIVNSCSFYPARVENRTHEIISEFGGNFELPVVYYRQIISVACGRSTGNKVPDSQIAKA
jgi:heterodisulfide reductase subunit B